MEISNTYRWETVSNTHEASIIHWKPLRFYAELFVENAPADVWSYFIDLATWQRWSPICGGCRLTDNRSEVHSGSILEINFAIVSVTMTVPCQIIEFDPPRSITWQGKKFGVEATHTYRFIPRNEGTLICNEETFAGVSFPLNGLMRAWYRASRLSKKSLQGLKRELLKTTERR